jgi:EpsI family protein
MKMDKRTAIVVGLLAVVMCVSVPLFLIVPDVKDETQVSAFPMEFNGWKGQDLPVDENAYAILETKNLILREYNKGDDKVYLYIVYSQDNRKVSHPPEVCFEGSGITVVEKEKKPLVLADGRTIYANELRVEKAGVVNVVYYWYKAGSFYTDNYLRQQARIALGRLTFKRTSNAMIRVSAEATLEQPQKAIQLIESFTKDASGYFASIIP